jgi:hypothetical protein
VQTENLGAIRELTKRSEANALAHAYDLIFFLGQHTHKLTIRKCGCGPSILDHAADTLLCDIIQKRRAKGETWNYARDLERLNLTVNLLQNFGRYKTLFYKDSRKLLAAMVKIDAYMEYRRLEMSLQNQSTSVPTSNIIDRPLVPEEDEEMMALMSSISDDIYAGRPTVQPPQPKAAESVDTLLQRPRADVATDNSPLNVHGMEVRPDPGLHTLFGDDSLVDSLLEQERKDSALQGVFDDIADGTFMNDIPMIDAQEAAVGVDTPQQQSPGMSALWDVHRFDKTS